MNSVIFDFHFDEKSRESLYFKASFFEILGEIARKSWKPIIFMVFDDFQAENFFVQRQK